MGELVQECYGMSLYQAAVEDKTVSVIYEQLEQIEEIFAGNEEFFDLLTGNRLDKEEQKKMLENIFGDKLHTYLLNFLKVLVDKGRMSSFSEITAFYKKQYYMQENIKEFIAITAIPLTKKQKNKLVETLKCSSNVNEIKLINKIQPDIIGGIKLKCNDKELDKSVDNLLRNMKEQLQEIII